MLVLDIYYRKTALIPMICTRTSALPAHALYERPSETCRSIHDSRRKRVASWIHRTNTRHNDRVSPSSRRARFGLGRISFYRPSAQVPVRSVAIRFAFGVLASAPGHFGFFGNFGDHGRKIGAAVGPVAKRLIRGFTAGTPGILAGLHFHNIRTLLGNFRLTHTRLQS